MKNRTDITSLDDKFQVYWLGSGTIYYGSSSREKGTLKEIYIMIIKRIL